MNIVANFKKWAPTFFWAEVAGTASAVFFGMITSYLLYKQSIISIGATLGENLGFYGVILIVRLRNRGMSSVSSVIGTLLIQFGMAELLDSLLIRPFCIYFSQQLIDNLPVALLIGKLSADVFFYIFAILFISKFEKR